MPSGLLSYDELEERDSLPYPEILRLGFFAETFGWDYAQTMAQPEWYTDDLMARQMAKNRVEHEISERLKEPHREDESPVTKNMSLAKVREMYGYGPEVPDEAIAELIGRR